jgi:hypothetical protein
VLVFGIMTTGQLYVPRTLLSVALFQSRKDVKMLLEVSLVCLSPLTSEAGN